MRNWNITYVASHDLREPLRTIVSLTSLLEREYGGGLDEDDRVPHPEFNGEQQKKLAELAAIAVDEMELRLAFKQVHHDLEALRKTQKALDDAKTKTEQIVQGETQFIANISHELRTPMNGILGMAYLLVDTKLDSIQREYIDTITHSGQNLLLLLNDVLGPVQDRSGRSDTRAQTLRYQNLFYTNHQIAELPRASGKTPLHEHPEAILRTDETGTGKRAPVTNGYPSQR